jgi:hypothetical protein
MFQIFLQMGRASHGSHSNLLYYLIILMFSRPFIHLNSSSLALSRKIGADKWGRTTKTSCVCRTPSLPQPLPQSVLLLLPSPPLSSSSPLPSAQVNHHHIVHVQTSDDPCHHPTQDVPTQFASDPPHPPPRSASKTHSAVAERLTVGVIMLSVEDLSSICAGS